MNNSNSQSTVFDQLAEILEARPPDAPWRTAASLAEQLRNATEEPIPTITENDVTGILRKYRGDRVRYSPSPSRNNLQVLWGAISVVGKRTRVYDLKREDQSARLTDQFHTLEAGDVFFSHSHRDMEVVFGLATRLASDGIRTWLAEVDIEQGEEVNQEIITAFGVCRSVLLFLSDHAFASIWTGKEVRVALRQNKPLEIIADLRSPMVRSFLKNGEFIDESENTARTVWHELSGSGFLENINVRVYGYPEDMTLTDFRHTPVNPLKRLPNVLGRVDKPADLPSLPQRSRRSR